MERTAGNAIVTIIGAGPVGIESALYAHECGYDVRVLEKSTVGGNIRQWQHIRMFSPFALNHSPLGKKLLQAKEIQLPEEDLYLTGKEYLENYLYPLSDIAGQRVNIEPDREVIAVSRQHTLKNDYIGDPRRQNFRFRILARDTGGDEYIYYSDYIIDASGTYGNHNWMGEGGIPALGELSLQAKIQYGLEDICNGNKAKYIGKVNLVVGSGHSAGTTMEAMKQLIAENPETSVVWVTYEDRQPPLIAISDDPLTERNRIVQEANEMINHPNVTWIPNSSIHSIQHDAAENAFQIEISTMVGIKTINVDSVIANVGFSPDNRIYSELQIHECYASRAPMKLAAALLEDSSADCLEQGGKGAEVLQNPESNFYIIGMKSYGKNSNFLLKTGYEQIRDVFQLITQNRYLDLYQMTAI